MRVGLSAPTMDKEQHPASDIETVAVDSLKALDPEWPIREADISIRIDGPIATATAYRHR